MTDHQDQQYVRYSKMAWVIYSLIVVVVAVVLVLFVAGDNEERFFFGLMTVAGAYVFRPTERFMAKMVHKYTGISKPVDTE